MYPLVVVELLRSCLSAEPLPNSCCYFFLSRCVVTVLHATKRLDFSAFTSRQTCLLASITASVLFSLVFMQLSKDLHHQHRPEANVSHLISVPHGGFPGFLLWHYKAKLKNNGDKTSPCFRSFWIGNISDKFHMYRLYYTFHLNAFNQPN
jgi:hypothetical protein